MSDNVHRNPRKAARRGDELGKKPVTSSRERKTPDWLYFLLGTAGVAVPSVIVLVVVLSGKLQPDPHPNTGEVVHVELQEDSKNESIEPPTSIQLESSAVEEDDRALTKSPEASPVPGPAPYPTFVPIQKQWRFDWTYSTNQVFDSTYSIASNLLAVIGPYENRSRCSTCEDLLMDSLYLSRNF